MRIFARCTALLIFFTSILGWSQAKTEPQAPKKIVVLKAAQIFDSKAGKYVTGQVVVIEGDRISQVVPAAGFNAPAGAEVLDLGSATLLPGLIDCHTHLGARADRYDEIYDFKDTPFQSAFAGVMNSRKTLEAGFTTVRDVGSLPFLAVDLRNSIAEGLIIGPRIVASGPGISITGGHGDLNNYSPQTRVTMFPEERDYGIADGADQIRHTIRAQVKYGVDVIKIMSTGGVLSKGDQPGRRSTRSKSSASPRKPLTWRDARSLPTRMGRRASRTRSPPASIQSSMPASSMTKVSAWPRSTARISSWIFTTTITS